MGNRTLFTCHLSLIIYLSNKLPTLQKLSTSEGYSTILPSISTSGQTTHSELKTRHTKDLLSASVETVSHNSAPFESVTPIPRTSVDLKSDFSKIRYASSVIPRGFLAKISPSPTSREGVYRKILQKFQDEH